MILLWYLAMFSAVAVIGGLPHKRHRPLQVARLMNAASGGGACVGNNVLPCLHACTGTGTDSACVRQNAPHQVTLGHKSTFAMTHSWLARPCGLRGKQGLLQSLCNFKAVARLSTSRCAGVPKQDAQNECLQGNTQGLRSSAMNASKQISHCMQ